VQSISKPGDEITGIAALNAMTAPKQMQLG